MKASRWLGVLFLCCLMAGSVAQAASVSVESAYPKFGQLKEGMTKEQVVEIAGKPASIMLKSEEHAEYWFYVEPQAELDGRIAFVDIVTVKIQDNHFVSVYRAPYHLQRAREL